MIEERSAIEALRAGVPNRVAIRLLGTSETALCAGFDRNLAECGKLLHDSRQCTGQVVAGGFGTGKSHLLGYLQERALKENFIVSCVAISKETPLFDLGKLYLSAMRYAIVPQRNDDAMTAVVTSYRPKPEAYDEFLKWAESPQSGLSPIFPALLYLIQHPHTGLEQMRQIARFFAGGSLSVATIKQWVRDAGATQRFQIKSPKQADLVFQRLAFVPRLIATAGYSGWVLLLDEVELIGRYSLLQRARSYAALARLLGLDAEGQFPGVVTVAAITDDFIDEVIRNRRDDEHCPRALSDRGEVVAADRARVGIGALQDMQTLLRAPTIETLQGNLQQIRGFYSRAYGWEATPVDIGEITKSKSMRQYIKSWVTKWDHVRIFGIEPEIETFDVVTDYEENADIEQPAEENGDDGDE